MSAARRTGPVTAADRVSDVLARDEALVEVFVRHAAHFTRLRNRAMRRVMARLVSVEDAARIAGVSSASLVRALNDALGITVSGDDTEPAGHDLAAASGVGAMSDGVPRRRRPPGAVVVDVDVRDELRSGREPFARVMSAVGALRAGEVLRLRAIFEPVPLYAVLEKRGLVHETSSEGPDDWSVWFWRADTDAASGAAPKAAASAPAAPGSHVVADALDVELDVRGLEPPEPMVRTLAALEALPEGRTLVQVNARVPQFLLPVLAERGYTCEIDESAADRVLVRIRRGT